MKVGVGASREEDGWGNRSSGSPNLLELAAACDLDKSMQLRADAGGSGGSMGVASGGEGYWRRHVGVAVTGWFQAGTPGLERVRGQGGGAEGRY